MDQSLAATKHYPDLNEKYFRNIFSSLTTEGVVIPPAKRSDSVSSVATIPDGYIIALGGLSNRTKTTNDQHLPLLGSIPVLGALFSNKTKSDSDSRFYVFIRANVLRNTSFEDLKRLSEETAQRADVHEGQWPHLEPQLVK